MRNWTRLCQARKDNSTEGNSKGLLATLQVRQYNVLLAAPPALAESPNMNALAARLAIEELCRLGVSTFAIAPGAAQPARLAILAQTEARDSHVSVGLQSSQLDCFYFFRSACTKARIIAANHASGSCPRLTMKFNSVACAGSRSSPLALAAAQHPRAQVTCCIDERSLAFWALGYGRATG